MQNNKGTDRLSFYLFLGIWIILNKFVFIKRMIFYSLDRLIT